MSIEKMQRFATSALVVVLAVVLTMAVASEAVKRSSASEASYQAWCTKFDKSFCTGADRQQRSEAYMEGFEAFQKQVAIIERHNADPASTFTMGLNEHFSVSTFADREARQKSGVDSGSGGATTTPGFSTGIVLGATCIYGNGAALYTGYLPNVTAMQYKLNVSSLNPLQNQGSFAICYAVVAAELLHGKFPNTPMASLSQMVACTDSTIGFPYANIGCDGGFIGSTLDFVNTQGNFPSNADYPMGDSNTKAGPCMKNSPVWRHMYGSTFSYVAIAGEDNYARAVSYFQKPLGVMLNAAGNSWSNYAGGLIQAGADCGTEATHALIYIGYGNYNNPYAPAYHVLRNSWGAWGGGQGIVNIAWTGNHVCGIGMYPALAIL